MHFHKSSSDYRWWLMLLLLIGVFFAILTAWSIHSAQIPGRKVTKSYGRERPAIISSDTWERHGWKYSFTLGSGGFRAELSDASGSPLRSVTGQLILTHPVRGDIAIPFSESMAGHYLAQLPSGLTGSFAAEVTLQRDGVLLNRQLQVHTP